MRIVISNEYKTLHFKEDCVWGEWGDWTNCTETCDGGEQNRTRSKTSGADDCTGNAIETRECNTNACAASGKRKRSLGIFEQLTEAFIRKKREVRYRCNLTMTYGVMFYDIRNDDVSSY